MTFDLSARVRIIDDKGRETGCGESLIVWRVSICVMPYIPSEDTGRKGDHRGIQVRSTHWEVTKVYLKKSPPLKNVVKINKNHQTLYIKIVMDYGKDLEFLYFNTNGLLLYLLICPTFSFSSKKSFVRLSVTVFEISFSISLFLS